MSSQDWESFKIQQVATKILGGPVYLVSVDIELPSKFVTKNRWSGGGAVEARALWANETNPQRHFLLWHR